LRYSSAILCKLRKLSGPEIFTMQLCSIAKLPIRYRTNPCPIPKPNGILKKIHYR
jgi:hypothetical protein